jgi:predicted permease
MPSHPFPPQGIFTEEVDAFMGTLTADLRYALRSLRSAPGFAVVAIVSLALGIGANTTIFSITNALLFSRLAVPEPDRLARIVRGHHSPLDPELIRYVRERATSFEAVMGERIVPGSLTTPDGRVDRFNSAVVSNDYFTGLGLKPALGRVFAARDEGSSEPSPVIVLSYGTWVGRFGGDSAIVGKSVRLNEQPFTIIGVAPDGFASSVLGWRPGGWVPLANVRELTGVPAAEWDASLYTIARLKPGVEPRAAAAELDGLATQLRQSDSTRYAQFNFRVLPAAGVDAEARQPITALTVLLSVMVAIVLLIACANVANLLLARATARRREIAVRVALGASRARLVRQLLTESLMLAAAGGVLGMLVTVWLTRVMVRVLPSDIPVALDVTPDVRVLMFSAGLCVLTGLLFGLAPALRASRPDLVEALKDDARLQGFRRSRLRSGFVVAQVTLGLVLLSVASLFLKSLINARSMDPGFDVSRVVDLRIDLGPRHYDERKGLAVHQEILARARAMTGVESAALTSTVLLEGSNTESPILLKDGPLTRGVPLPIVSINAVTPDYFRTLSIPLIAGRAIGETDIRSNAPVVVISQAMANRFWPNENAIGKTFRLGSDTSARLQVIGIARDVKYYTLGESPRSLVYLPVTRQYESGLTLQVRTAVAAAAIGPRLEAILHELEPTLPRVTAKPIRDDMFVALVPAQAGAVVFGSFGLLALILATVGLYGVTSYVVGQRTREMGVRAALGAQRMDLIRLAIGDSMRLVGIGVVLGLAGAYGLARLVTSLLYDAHPGDPATLGGATALLVAVAAAAAYVPARRAAKVDPVSAMRSE